MEQQEFPQEGETVTEDNSTENNSFEAVQPAPTMESLLEQEDLALDFPRPGEIRTGVIVSVSDEEVLVGVGTKSEGVIPKKELDQLDPEDKAKFIVGEEVTVYVVTPEDQHGNLLLSHLRALEENDWTRAEKMLESEEVYEGSIDGYNKGGLIVNLGLLRGFVPGSQISLSRRMAYRGNTPDQRWGKMVGEPIATRVIEVDRERRRLILSERAALQEARELLKERLLEELEEGEVRSGRVTSLADFGAFVNINGADGLVHLTEISWERINHPSEVLKVGQEVKVKVIDIDRERKRIGLSIRALQDDPWHEKVASLQDGQLVEAKIVRLVKFGAFARLEGFGVEGLIHISEMSDQRIEHPREVLQEGEQVTLRVINLDPKRRRIGLSLRKVDSPAYADLDWKLALAEDQGEAEEGEAVEADLDESTEPTTALGAALAASEAQQLVTDLPDEEAGEEEIEEEVSGEEASLEEPAPAAEVEAPPAEAESPAAEVEAPPAEAESPAAEVEAAPAEAESPAAEVEAPPAEAESPVAEIETPEPEVEALDAGAPAAEADLAAEEAPDAPVAEAAEDPGPEEEVPDAAEEPEDEDPVD